jgi:DNA-binding XRE family transcriptional regulator
MEARKIARSAGVDYSAPSDADKIRHLIEQCGLTQRAAARELEINERTMRGYCAGDKVPRVVMLALERLVDSKRRVA